jgi:hypothetical protein
MRDLEIAKRALRGRELSLVVVKCGRVIFESNLQGLSGLILAIDTLGLNLHNSSVADKVVGKAAALLLAYSHISEVYAEVISKDGLETLDEYGIRVEYASLIPRILNRRGEDICPFEKLSQNLSSPEEAYKILKAHVKWYLGAS